MKTIPWLYLLLIPAFFCAVIGFCEDDNNDLRGQAVTEEARQTSEPGAASFREEAKKEDAAGHSDRALEEINKAVSYLESKSGEDSFQLADLLRERVLLKLKLGKSGGLEDDLARFLKMVIRLRAHDDENDFQKMVISLAAELEKKELGKLAVPLLEASKKFSGRPVIVHLKLASIKSSQGEYDSADQELRTFFEACENHENLCSSVNQATGRLIAANIESVKGNPKGAFKHYKKIDDFSDDVKESLPSSMIILTECGMGEWARTNDHRKEAKARFERALRKSRNEKPACAVEGIARIAFDDGDIEKAEKNAEEAYQLRTNELEKVRSGALLGAVKLRLGKLDDADRLFSAAQKYFTEKKSSESIDGLLNRFNIALLKQEKGQVRESRLEFGRILASLEEKLGSAHPELLSLQLAIGKAELEMDHPFEAEAAFNRAYEIAKRHDEMDQQIKALQWLGTVRMRRGDFPIAARKFRAALKLKGEEKFRPEAAPVYLALGECLLKMKKYANSRPLLKRALDGADKDSVLAASARLALGVLELEAGGGLERAEDLIRPAAEAIGKLVNGKGPYQAEAMVALGRLTAAKGDYKTAIKLLEDGIDLRESSGSRFNWSKAEAYGYLGSFYEKNGKPDKAAVVYHKAVDAFLGSHIPELPPRIQAAVDGMIRADIAVSGAGH